MKRFIHIVCLLAIVGMGLITPGGGYAEDVTTMMDCCDPEAMQMMQMDTQNEHQMDCMDSSGCQMPEFGCSNNMNTVIGMSAGLDAVTAVTGGTPQEHTTDTFMQGISPGLIAPPPIA